MLPPSDFLVKFIGPDETQYSGGEWTVHVTLPPNYPFQSPSIGFNNRMFHPNVDERSGSVCLDVINQTWSPMFGKSIHNKTNLITTFHLMCYIKFIDLVNIFETFLPQLLRYPNPSDPLNGEAANLLLRDPIAYNKRIHDYIQKYASGGKQQCFEDIKDGPDGFGPRTDSVATATTAESIGRDVTVPIKSTSVSTGEEEDGNMSDASELSDL